VRIKHASGGPRAKVVGQFVYFCQILLAQENVERLINLIVSKNDEFPLAVIDVPSVGSCKKGFDVDADAFPRLSGFNQCIS